MSLARERSRPGELVTATAYLRGLLDLARSVHRDSALSEVLAAVARTVSETLGFATVAINLYRPERDEYEITAVHGSSSAGAALLGEVTSSASWSPLLDPRFLWHDVFFIPEGALAWDGGVTSYTPELTPRADAGDDAWRPADALLVPLEGASGRHYGIISVDEPKSGLRPSAEEAEVLSAVAAHAALAIERAHQVAELQEATARNRAVIESSLDGVIGIDRRGRVLEFNPAAERMFGFRTTDVVGRELVELIIPPKERSHHRLGLAQGIERGDDWRLPGKRIELTAQRADGSLLPVELTLTLVSSSDQDGPIVYAFFRDLSEQRRGEAQLTYLAYHDQLTGLPNRILVEQELSLAVARARRTQRAVALMFVDLDDFKEVNDRLGHPAGDRMLAAVAKRLRAVLRESDLLARLGGDEFVVVLADLDEDPATVAEMVGGKLIDALHEPFMVAGAELSTGASIGLSVFPHDAHDTEELMRHADIAMYQTKAAGGGRVSFHRQPAGGSDQPGES